MNDILSSARIVLNVLRKVSVLSNIWIEVYFGEIRDKLEVMIEVLEAEDPPSGYSDFINLVDDLLVMEEAIKKISKITKSGGMTNKEDVENTEVLIDTVVEFIILAEEKLEEMMKDYADINKQKDSVPTLVPINSQITDKDKQTHQDKQAHQNKQARQNKQTHQDKQAKQDKQNKKYIRKRYIKKNIILVYD